jgi:excinuclease UvrABC ATPase subunit
MDLVCPGTMFDLQCCTGARYFAKCGSDVSTANSTLRDLQAIERSMRVLQNVPDTPRQIGGDMTELKSITIRGAREHNLKNVDLDLPRNSLIVMTGLSGSGKSSLAFDTIYAEGQRRYVESLSAYARQFLEMMQKPDVDQIDGLSPAISIEQKTTSRNPRSTVGTVTEIYDYMRLLFARVGIPYSPATGLPIESQTVSQMVDRVLALEEGTGSICWPRSCAGARASTARNSPSS